MRVILDNFNDDDKRKIDDDDGDAALLIKIDQVLW